MGVPTQITDHADRAKARRLQQFKQATNLAAFMDAMSSEVQAYEDAVYPMLALLDIDTQVDDQLDKIGELVNEPRNGASDANYRIAIRAKIGVIVGSGTADEIIQLFDDLTGSTTIDYLEDYPAGFCIYGDAASYPSATLQALDDSAVGGVYVCLLTRLLQEGTTDLITTEASDAIYLRSESTGR
jgi:hypothetical protein